MPFTTIQQRWESYLREVIPVDAPAIQISECRRAFFAGARGMLGSVLEASADDRTEDEGADDIEKLSEELDAFKRDVVSGRA